MTRNFLSKKLMVPFCGVLTMGLVACSGGDDDDDASSPTPTQVPTTPTPAFDDYFRVTEMLIGTETQGVDVDESGDIDNNIEPTLNAISDTLYDAVVVAVCYEIETPDDIPEDPDPNQCTERTQKQILSAVEGILDAVLSVESLSSAVNDPIQNFDRNYVINLKEESRLGNAELVWYTGLFDGTGFGLGQELGTQGGKLDASGNGSFGPGNLTVTLSFTIPGQTEPLEFALVLYSGYTDVVSYDKDELEDGMTGGALAMADLLGFVESILERIDDVIPPPQDGGEDPFVPEDILATVEEVITPFADIDLGGNGSVGDSDDGFSIGLVFQAGHIVPVD